MASRANQRAKAKASKGDAAGDSAPVHDPFPSPLRVIMRGALVLLAADSTLTADQLGTSAADARGAGTAKPRAELLAAKVEGAMDKASAAARAGAALLDRPDGKPDQAATLTMRLGAPYLVGATVTADQRALASVGEVGGDWSAGARAVESAAAGPVAVVAPRGAKAASPVVAAAAAGGRSGESTPGSVDSAGHAGQGATGTGAGSSGSYRWMPGAAAGGSSLPYSAA